VETELSVLCSTLTFSLVKCNHILHYRNYTVSQKGTLMSHTITLMQIN